MEPPRSAEQRKKDTLRRLDHDEDAWVATADPDGDAHLVPLCLLWDGTAVIVSTPRSSPTARNLGRGGRVRVAVGHTRDVVMVEGTGQPLPEEQVPTVSEAFVARHGWDPRDEEGHGYFRIRPLRIQAWREVEELPGRTLMRDGTWLT